MPPGAAARGRDGLLEVDEAVVQRGGRRRRMAETTIDSSFERHSENWPPRVARLREPPAMVFARVPQQVFQITSAPVFGVGRRARQGALDAVAVVHELRRAGVSRRGIVDPLGARRSGASGTRGILNVAYAFSIACGPRELGGRTGRVLLRDRESGLSAGNGST